MADVQFTNFTLQSSNHAFSAIWKLTRALKKAGWTYLSSSDGTAKDTTGVAASDKWGGNADPATDTYNTALDGVAAWWNAAGPTVVKIPFTTASTGIFLRGEKITQATSLAEGEIIGYEFDGVSTGHIVVLPRVNTFDNTHVITGASSNATLTPSGTVEFFVHEIVIWKAADLLNGSIYMQRVSNQTENASRFSVIAPNATTIVAPGGGTGANAFPSAGSYVLNGIQNSGTITHVGWFNINLNMGRAQIVATNATPETGVSADGTWWVLLGDTSSSTQSQFLGYFRLDNSEDGDLDPFAGFKLSSTGYSNALVRVSSASGSSFSSGAIMTGSAPSNLAWRGWRRRGFSSNDAFLPLTTAGLNYGSNSALLMTDNNANPETIAASYVSKRLREPIWIVSADNTKKCRKGTVRWLFQVQGGTTFDTWDSRQKICIAASGTSQASILAGPYDGVSTPLQV